MQRFPAFRSALAACLLLLTSAVAAAAAAAPHVIERVTVLPMTPGGARQPDSTVIIENGRITWVGHSRDARLPVAAKRADGRGKYLLPGFTDMHMHLPNDRLMRLWTGNHALPDGHVRSDELLLPYVAAGVTQVFNLSAMSETIGQRVDVNSGRVLGPRIATAAMIDGSPPTWPSGMSRAAASPVDGRQAVRDAAAEGYEFIKVYGRLDLDTFTAIVDEARKTGMRVLGHIPQRETGLTDSFFQPGFDLVAHAEEFAQQTNPPAHDAIPRYVELARRSKTWLTATLTLDERILEQMKDPSTLAKRDDLLHLSPDEYRVVLHANPYQNGVDEQRIASIQKIVDFNRELVRAFAAAGIPVLTGTDSPVPGVVPGSSLHDEFESLSSAGMTNLQILEGTTRLPAQWLGTLADRGTVEVGKRADLVLLDADPLEHISHTRRISAVILGGKLLPRAELDRRMRKLADRNRAKPPVAGATAP
jgi:imidazolonepropionase-like amidohydrolase